MSADEPGHGAADPEQAPLFRVVGGNPTDEELAAVVAVLTALAQPGPSTAASPLPESGWSAYWRAAGAPLLPGPGAWRDSGRAG